MKNKKVKVHELLEGVKALAFEAGYRSAIKDISGLIKNIDVEDRIEKFLSDEGKD